MKVFITRALPEPIVAPLRQAGVTLNFWTEKRDLTHAELIDLCRAHDALLSIGHNALDATFFEAVSHLKVVSLLSVGYDHVDVAAATRAGIPIGHTPDVLSDATADTAFLLLMATARKALYHHKRIAQGQWGFNAPFEDLGIDLHSKTLGIFGLGKIGFEMARRCKTVYSMDILYHNRSTNARAEQELKAQKVSFDELLAQSDVVSVHTALTPETRGRFDKHAFGKMKPGAIFINTARGGIHHEEDLTEALRNGTLWGAGLDVTNPEPMRQDNALLTMPNATVFPHIGSATLETRKAMADRAIQNLLAGLNGKPLPFAVNPTVNPRS